jgi:hypothetical protein
MFLSNRSWFTRFWLRCSFSTGGVVGPESAAWPSGRTTSAAWQAPRHGGGIARSPSPRVQSTRCSSGSAAFGCIVGRTGGSHRGRTRFAYRGETRFRERPGSCCPLTALSASACCSMPGFPALGKAFSNMRRPLSHLREGTKGLLRAFTCNALSESCAAVSDQGWHVPCRHLTGMAVCRLRLDGVGQISGPRPAAAGVGTHDVRFPVSFSRASCSCTNVERSPALTSSRAGRSKPPSGGRVTR